MAVYIAMGVTGTVMVGVLAKVIHWLRLPAEEFRNHDTEGVEMRAELTAIAQG